MVATMNIKKIFSFVLLIAFFCMHRTVQSAEDISCKKVLELDFGESSPERRQELLKRYVAGESYDDLWSESVVNKGDYKTKAEALDVLDRCRRQAEEISAWARKHARRAMEMEEGEADYGYRLQGKNPVARSMVGWNDLIETISPEELREIVGPLDLSGKT